MKFGLREVCNVVLKARKDGTFLGKEFKKGQPVLWFDSLKTSGLEGSGEIIYARGGRGNTKLVSWTGDREVTFTMEDALISPMSMALLTAGSLRKAGTGDNTITNHRTENIQVFFNFNDGEYISFKGDFLDDDENTDVFYSLVKESNLPVFIQIGEQWVNCKDVQSLSYDSQNNKFILTNDDEKFSQAELEQGITKIDYYEEKTSKMIQIDISPDSFGQGFYLEGETLFREYGEGGYDQAAEFIVPNCKVQSNFNFSMASTGDPSTFTFTMDAFPAYLDLDSTVGDKVLCAIQVFEEDKKTEGGN